MSPTAAPCTDTERHKAISRDATARGESVRAVAVKLLVPWAGFPQFNAAMISTLLAAWCLVALTVTIHAAGLSALVRRASLRRHTRRFWPMTGSLVRIAWSLILLHLAEIGIWALFYWWQKCLPDAESALYFSGTTYTTVGFGDLVLPKEWRLLGPVEALSGILMCGLSTGLFFAVVSRIRDQFAAETTDP